jgi:hypothetical protein
VQKSSLVETQPAAAAAAANQKSPSKTLTSSFSECFISSGKQGGGATVLREGHYTVMRESFLTTSQNINNLGKAAVLHFALFCDWGLIPLLLYKPNSICQLLSTAVLISDSHRLLITLSPQLDKWDYMKTYDEN